MFKRRHCIHGVACTDDRSNVSDSDRPGEYCCPDEHGE
jgi:hypothetical protein